LSSRAVVNYHYQGILVSQPIRNSLLSLIIEESDEKFSLSAFCLHGKHIVIEIDQCNGQERLKNMLIMKSYVLEWFSNCLIEILILPSCRASWLSQTTGRGSECDRFLEK